MLALHSLIPIAILAGAIAHERGDGNPDASGDLCADGSSPVAGLFDPWEAPVQDGGVRIHPTREGLQVVYADGTCDGRWGLSLTGWGRAGEAPEPVRGAISVQGNRFECGQAALTQWFVQDEDGLEQGFDLAKAPPGDRSSPVYITLEVLGGWAATLDADALGVSFTHADCPGILRYEGLAAWDATGRRLATELILDTGKLLIGVFDDGALYPVIIDPLIVAKDQRLYPSDPPRVQRFGEALANDGDTLVVGAPSADGVTNRTGAVYVLVRNALNWTHQARLVAVDGEYGDGLGRAVAVQGDVLVAGADSDEGNAGAAFVFRRAGTDWTREAKLTDAGGIPGDKLGYSVAIDGSTAVVGVWGYHNPDFGAGAAFVYVHDGVSWVEQARLTAHDAAWGDHLGGSVAIEDDVAFLAAKGDDDQGYNSGSVYVFRRLGTTWTQTEKLLASDGSVGYYFGSALAVDAGRLAVGAKRGGGASSRTGSAYVFEEVAGSWTETALLVASDGIFDDHFGYSIDVKGDSLVTGAPSVSGGGIPGYGAAYAFRFDGVRWAESVKLKDLTGTSGQDGIGRSVAISGESVIAGAWQADNSAGAVNVFESPFDPVEFCFGDGSGTTCPCGNASAPGTGSGCRNSTGPGARSEALGHTSMVYDGLLVEAHGLLPSQSALLFAGTHAINGGDGTAFGDGLRCAGTDLVRLGIEVPDGVGEARWGPGLGASGGWNAGDTRYFQVWYRDSVGGPCGSGFNTTNGLKVRFNP
ncbi:MAG: hypothetical protein QF903_10090 [Planctomycetota bacterium]|nr:hypothetical protein [Planctomycetota bacterium]MDP6989816.1 hypothetical protein [Planctomycetota bacterium]